MAGMLPGVESARRRRLRGSSGWSDSSSVIGSGFGSARSRISHDFHLNPTSFLQGSMEGQSDEDEKLGGAAREAKERLDGRLRGHLKSSEIKRQNSQERLRGASVGRRPTTTMVMQNLGMEVFGLEKIGTRRFSWGKRGFNRKSSNQDECAICLDQFKAGEQISRLPCVHRFHSNCLLPWLERNAHCPCCRTTIFCSN